MPKPNTPRAATTSWAATIMEILGVRIDKITYQEALEVAKKLLVGKGKHYIVTPNPEIIVKATKDAQFRKVLNKADLSVPDGMGLVWMAKLTGKDVKERVAGTDLLLGLAILAEEHGFNMFLLGAGEGVAKKASEALKKEYPKLEIVGACSGDADSRFDKETRGKISNKEIDILAVAYGAPKQEKWIERNLPKLNVKLAIGVGGAFDYISGEKARAPVWVQKIGLEWAFRLVNEPRRLKRQLALPHFVYLVLKERFRD
jgi:N-acetylglucosaminyldiphosphoundecaprenol N-acetyl-beta-D-mannosaminyltransferase